MLRIANWLAGTAFYLVAASAALADPGRLTLRIDAPAPGRVSVDRAGMVFVSGIAFAHSGELPKVDVVFVLDVSGSTADASGADVNGDGKVTRGGRGRLLGLGRSQNPDSILAAEIAAVRTLLDQLDTRTTRVGVVIFSGDDNPRSPDAFVEVELTRDYRRVNEALDGLLIDGPNGGTNMHAGILRGTVELLGSKSAVSRRRPGAQRIMMFLTDGIPTLPYQLSSRESAVRAIEVARMAAKHDVRIYTYAIGRQATRQPLVPLEAARVTGGWLMDFYGRRLSTESEALTRILAEVKDLCARAGIPPAALNYERQVVEGQDVSRRTITFAVEGTYAQLRQLINFLELSDSFLILDQVALRGNDVAGSSLRINLSLSTLFTASSAALADDLPDLES